MKRVMISSVHDHIGQTVTCQGWLDIRRDHGKLIFFDLRDVSGKIQATVLPKPAEVHAIASTMRSEWVIEVEGVVQKRPEKMVNKDEPNGDVELLVSGLKILNQAETPAFSIDGPGYDINEETRLEHRYLDLRRPRLARNIKMRHKVIKTIRDYMDKEGFYEIETPLLTKSTPEGSRDYVVPSRLYQGSFYALPQSPQQYKQLLMSSGFERYFQIARCMRDEDTRGDRQPEFTQLDMEMSFVQREDVMALNEALLIEIVTKHFPEKKIQQIPFPRLTYKEAMEKYNSDKPDIRTDKNDPNLLAFCWVIDWPFFEKTPEGTWTFTHNPFSAAMPEHKEMLLKGENIGEIFTTQYDVALNGVEIGGGSIRNHEPDAFIQVMKILGHSEEKIQQNFGHIIKAFKSGTPPHGGIAWGLDRFLSILLNEPNIREVIAFPKTGEGRDPMMQSPAPIGNEQLLELGLKINPSKGK